MVNVACTLQHDPGKVAVVFRPAVKIGCLRAAVNGLLQGSDHIAGDTATSGCRSSSPDTDHHLATLEGVMHVSLLATARHEQ